MKNRWIISILLLVLVIPSLTIFYDTGWFVFFLSSWIVPVSLIGFYCYEEEEKEKRFSREELFQIFWIFLLIFILTLPFLYIQKAYVDNGIIDLKGKIIVWGLEIAKAPCSKDWDFVFDGILVITEALTFLVGGVLVFEGLRDEIWKFIKKTKIFPKILVLIAIFLRFVFLWKTYDFSIIEGLEYNILFGRISFIFVRSIPFLFITLPLLYIFYFTEKKRSPFSVIFVFLKETIKKSLSLAPTGVLILSFTLLLPLCDGYHSIFNLRLPQIIIEEGRKIDIFIVGNMLFGAITLLWGTLSIFMFNFEDIFEKNFNSELKRFIQKIEEHIILIGYDDLSKIDIKYFLLREKTIRKKKVLTPDLDLKIIPTNFIVVSKKQSFFHRLYTDPLLQKFGVIDIGENFLILGIVGNMNEEFISNLCKISKCRKLVL